MLRPRARARIWLPRQMPNTGTPASRTPRIASTAYVAAAGSPGPLLKNTPSGEAARICSAVAVAGTTRTSQPRAARFRGVDALIPRSTATTRYLAGPGRADGVRLGRAHHPGQVGPGHLRAGEHPLEQPAGLALHRADRRPHGALLAYPPGQQPGAADGDAGHALGPQVGVQVPGGPPAGREPGRLAHHVTADPDLARLGILVVDARVADVRRGHRDDLAAVRRIGQRLLVPGHPGVEDHLAERLALRAEGGAVQRGAVLQDEQGRVRHVSACPFRPAFRRARSGRRAGRWPPPGRAVPSRRTGCCGSWTRRPASPPRRAPPGRTG